MHIEILTHKDNNTLELIFNDEMAKYHASLNNSNSNSNTCSYPHSKQVSQSDNEGKIKHIVEAEQTIAQYNTDIDTIVKEIGDDDSRGNVPAWSVFTLVMLTSFSVACSIVLHDNTIIDFSRKVILMILAGIIGLGAGLIPSFALGIATQKIYFRLWKKSREGVRLFSLKKKKEKDIDFLSDNINQLSNSLMNEDFYFDCMLKFDAMVERLNEQYDASFLASENFKNEIHFEALRKSLTDFYLEKNGKKFCLHVHYVLNLEKRVAQLWKTFQDNDRTLLESRYQQFAKNKTPEMNNIL
jgi:hypothetical protein